MKEENFEMLLDNSINNYIDSYFDIPVYPDENHEFSKRFERKMNKFIKKQKHFHFFILPIFKIGFKRTVIVIITLILMSFTSVMSVEAWRSAFFGFIALPFRTHTDVEVVKDKNAPNTIEYILEPYYIPDGFTLTEKYNIKNACCMRIYSNDFDSFDFTQWVKSQYAPSVNTENQEMEPITINGFDGFCINMGDNNGCLVSWVTKQLQ